MHESFINTFKCIFVTFDRFKEFFFTLYDSCTYKTSAQYNTINRITFYYIDTQGLTFTDTLDAEYITQIVEFLKKTESLESIHFFIIQEFNK